MAEDQKNGFSNYRTHAEPSQHVNARWKHAQKFFLPVSWPPSPVKDTDWVALGGHPGAWRERVACNVVEFKGYSLGSTPVTSISEQSIGCQFARDRWVTVNRTDGLPEPQELGMSGGPHSFCAPESHY